MKKIRISRAAAASAIQVGGLLVTAGAVALVAVWAGALTLGVGLVVFGVALERSAS